MTKEQAAQIVDPDTRVEALAEIEYYAGFDGERAKLNAYTEACQRAAAALRESSEEE